jgi:biopolymer transport protein ExbD
MRVPRRPEGDRTSISLRMTSLIDCFFLLMIFFLLTIKFQAPEGVLQNRLPQIDAPGGIAQPQQAREIVKLRIKLAISGGQQPKIYLQDRPVTSYGDLALYLGKLPADTLLVIEPEPRVPYKYVIGTYNTCLKAQRPNIVFAVRKG